MLFKVFGIRPVNFTDSSSGNQITGTTLYLGSRNEYVTGMETSKVFVKNSIDCSKFRVNDVINVSFNQYGKIDSIEKATQEL